jgi:hypothetical protein
MSMGRLVPCRSSFLKDVQPDPMSLFATPEDLAQLLKFRQLRSFATRMISSLA